MTKCQNPVKTCQMRPNFVGVTKIGMENSNMVIISYVEIIFINYSRLMTQCQNAVRHCQLWRNFGRGTKIGV